MRKQHCVRCPRHAWPSYGNLCGQPMSTTLCDLETVQPVLLQDQWNEAVH